MTLSSGIIPDIDVYFRTMNSISIKY